MADWDLPQDPLLALREGDPGPFESFVRSHTRLLFAFFRRLDGKPALAIGAPRLPESLAFQNV